MKPEDRQILERRAERRIHNILDNALIDAGDGAFKLHPMIAPGVQDLTKLLVKAAAELADDVGVTDEQLLARSKAELAAIFEKGDVHGRG